MSGPTTALASGTLTVEVTAVDPVTDRHGVTPTSTYAELYWLPIVGPTALLLGRRLFALTVGKGATNAERRTFDAEQLASALGVGGHATRKHPPLRRALDRLATFGLLTIDEGVAYLPRKWPPLPARHLRRLPVGLQNLHAKDRDAIVAAAAPAMNGAQ